MYYRSVPTTSSSSEVGLAQLVERAYDFMGAMGRWSQTLLEDLGLTEAMADVIWCLEGPKEPISQRVLAQRLHCDPSNVSYLVDRLEERGLIKRRIDTSDHRVNIVSLSSAGLRVRTEIVRAATSHSPLARLSRTDQKQLHDLLAKTIKPDTVAAIPSRATRPAVVRERARGDTERGHGSAIYRGTKRITR
jgi:DNA-binding MarR family transcriptional regulator